MASSLGSIFVDLLLGTSKFDSGAKSSARTVTNMTNSMNRDLGRAKASFAGVLNPVTNISAAIGRLGGIAAAALSVTKIAAYSDNWKNLESRLNLATGSMAETARVQEELFKVAQETSTPLQNNIDAYTRLSQSLNTAQKSQYDLIRVTELMSKTLAISGTNAAGAATFFTQFGQAASSDFKAVGQELQTFADQNPRFLKAIQSVTAGTGKSLRQMAADGELSTQKLLDALLKSGAGIDAEAERLNMTIGKSFTRLDNAFLKFIGQSDAVKNGTSSIALAINALADNFDVLAQGAIALAAVLAGPFIAAQVRVVAALVATTLATARLDIAFGTLAYGSTAAAVAMTGLAGAAAVASRAMALLGGPIVVGFAAAFFGAAEAIKAVNGENTQAIQIQDAIGKSILGTTDLTNQYANASKSLQKQIRQQTIDAIKDYDRQLEAYEIAATKFNNMSRTERGLGRVAGWVGLGPDVDAIQESFKGLSEERNRLQQLLNGGYDTIDATTSAGAGGGKASKKDKFADVINGLKLETQELQLQIDLNDKKGASLIAAQSRLRAYNQIQEAGIKLTDKQRAQLEQYLELQERQQTQLESLGEQKKADEEADRRRQQAIDDYGASFESAFEDAAVSGKKLGDVLDSLLQDIIKIMIRTQFTQPLVSAIGGAFKGGGAGGGLFDNIFGSIGSFFGDLLPSFAVGTNNVPEDMIANIHKGEMIIPAAQASAIRQGGGSGVMVNIHNYGNSNVETKRKNNSGGVELDVLIDQTVADKLSKPGTRSNQAYKGLGRQALVRRG